MLTAEGVERTSHWDSVGPQNHYHLHYRGTLRFMPRATHNLLWGTSSRSVSNLRLLGQAARDFIAKPFMARQLQYTMAKCLERTIEARQT